MLEERSFNLEDDLTRRRLQAENDSDTVNTRFFFPMM